MATFAVSRKIFEIWRAFFGAKVSQKIKPVIFEDFKYLKYQPLKLILARQIGEFSSKQRTRALKLGHFLQHFKDKSIQILKFSPSKMPEQSIKK